MLSVRELNTESISNRSWVNERLTFTHGYGLTLGPVNQVTTEGLPGALHPGPAAGLDRRPAARSAQRLLRRVVIELRPRQDATARVPLSARRATTRPTFYEGARAVCQLRSFLRRLLFAIRFASTDILVTQPDHQRQPDHVPPADRRPRAHARAVPHVRRRSLSGSERRPARSGFRTRTRPRRTIPTRRRRTNAGAQLHPQLRQDHDRRVQRVVSMLPGRSGRSAGADVRSTSFPACCGRSPTCPPSSGVTSGTPKTSSDIQALMYATYHMTNPVVFYNKEDQWQVPVLDSPTELAPMQPYYTMMRLPGETKTEFIQMLPFTPRAKDNLAAWMVGAQRRERLREARGVPVPEAEDRLRSETDHRPDQPGPGDLAADHAVEPAGLRGHLGHAARHSDRGVTALRAAALSAIAGGPHSGAEAGQSWPIRTAS